jgi:hypothetical protein
MSDITQQRSFQFKDFSGGLNNYWDPSSIADNEVPYLLNMEFTPNGALTSRPPIVDRGIPHPLGSSSTQHIDILGYYTPENGKVYLIAATTSKTWALEVQQYGFGSWIEIWSSAATAVVQYANQVIMSKGTAGGARWLPSRPASSSPANPVIDGATDTLAISTMPALFTLVLFKERMFGSGIHGTNGETAIYWSDTISLDFPTGVYTWNADSNVYVGRGDGQPITELVADYNGLIVFKRNATFNFVYSDLPEEGTISLVQHNIGAQNKRSVAGYQNGFVVLHNRTLYKFQNNIYGPINAQKVRFEYSQSFNTSTALFDEAVSIVGDRALVFTQGNLYSLNLMTGSWSQWSTTTNLAYVLEVPKARGFQWRYPIALGTRAATANKLYFIQDYPISEWYELSGGSVVENGGSEAFECVMRTKIYDFGAPSEWKRMYWWAADVAANGEVSGIVIPIGVPVPDPTWDKLDQYTWDSLEGRYWDDLFSGATTVSTEQTVTGDGPQRVALKMDKGIRFRRAFFELYLSCDGTAETAPAQIFSLTPMVGLKAKMTKDVA